MPLAQVGAGHSHFAAKQPARRRRFLRGRPPRTCPSASWPAGRLHTCAAAAVLPVSVEQQLSRQPGGSQPGGNHDIAGRANPQPRRAVTCRETPALVPCPGLTSGSGVKGDTGTLPSIRLADVPTGYATIRPRFQRLHCSKVSPSADRPPCIRWPTVGERAVSRPVAACWHDRQ